MLARQQHVPTGTPRWLGTCWVSCLATTVPPSQRLAKGKAAMTGMHSLWAVAQDSPAYTSLTTCAHPARAG